MKKVDMMLFFEYIIEIVWLILLHNRIQFHHIDFYRYLLIYLAITLIVRPRHSIGTLVWNGTKTICLSGVLMLCCTLIMQPLKTINIELVTLNFMFCSLCMGGNLFIEVIFRRLCFPFFAEKILVIGTGPHARKIIQVCQNNRYAMLDVVAIVNLNKTNGLDNFAQEYMVSELDIKVINFEDIEKICSTHTIECAIIAVTEGSKQLMATLMHEMQQYVKVIKFLPRVNGLMSYDTLIEDYDGLLVVSSVLEKNGILSQFMKRIIDICAGIVGCILLIPITIIIKYKYIKSGDYTSIIFKQIRIGKDGNQIKIYKFRSMVPNAEKILEELMKKDESIKEEYLTNKKLKDDPRITPVGDFIRKTSIDEFPQFINVLKGEMTLIGPRPYLLREKADMEIYYASIIKMKPGITGMWQVSGRSDTSFTARLKLDEYYCKNSNFWLDLTIFIKTIKGVMSKKGAI